MGRRNLINATIFLAVVFAVLVIVGSQMSSGPSQEAIDADRRPSTTTTTEPPPEGFVIVKISNGVFRPSNLKLDLNEIQSVRWENEDDVEYIILGNGGIFESPPLNQGDTFEFDFSTLDPGIHRYNAIVGFQRLPGSVDTRPDQ